jgi:sugar/nucleoside kinase (ribokinase family)
MNGVLCHGALCADQYLFLPRYPQQGEGVRVRQMRWVAGGNALNEARALVRWGVPVTLTGDRLGADAAGDLLAAELTQLGLTSALARDPTAATPICHVLITPDGERSILALRPDPPQAHLPSAAQLADSRIVSVTRYGPFTAEVAAQAHAAGKVVLVGDALRPDEPFTACADVIVTSARLLADTGHPVAAQIAALHARRRATIVVSDGPRPAQVIWDAAGTTQYAEVAPPAIVTDNTTGAGDLFRAGVVAGLWYGWPWPHILEYACTQASAAIRRR